MLNVGQFRDLVIRPALAMLGGRYDSEAAVELLLGTAVQESTLTHLRQLGGGPALGLFQMEPATHDDIWENFLAYQPELREKVDAIRWPFPEPHAGELVMNLAYATIMARIHYFRVPQALPDAGDLEGQAEYWKEYYNTHLGAGTVEEYIENYNDAVHRH